MSAMASLRGLWIISSCSCRTATSGFYRRCADADHMPPACVDLTTRHANRGAGDIYPAPTCDREATVDTLGLSLDVAVSNAVSNKSGGWSVSREAEWKGSDVSAASNDATCLLSHSNSTTFNGSTRFSISKGGCTVHLLFSRKFPTVEKRWSKLMREHYVPLPCDAEFLESFLTQVLLEPVDDTTLEPCGEFMSDTEKGNHGNNSSFYYDFVQEMSFKEPTWPCGPLVMLTIRDPMDQQYCRWHGAVRNGRRMRHYAASGRKGDCHHRSRRSYDSDLPASPGARCWGVSGEFDGCTGGTEKDPSQSPYAALAACLPTAVPLWPVVFVRREISKMNIRCSCGDECRVELVAVSLLSLENVSEARLMNLSEATVFDLPEVTAAFKFLDDLLELFILTLHGWDLHGVTGSCGDLEGFKGVSSLPRALEPQLWMSSRSRTSPSECKMGAMQGMSFSEILQLAAPFGRPLFTASNILVPCLNLLRSMERDSLLIQSEKPCAPRTENDNISSTNKAPLQQRHDEVSKRSATKDDSSLMLGSVTPYNDVERRTSSVTFSVPPLPSFDKQIRKLSSVYHSPLFETGLVSVASTSLIDITGIPDSSKNSTEGQATEDIKLRKHADFVQPTRYESECLHTGRQMEKNELQRGTLVGDAARPVGSFYTRVADKDLHARSCKTIPGIGGRERERTSNSELQVTRRSRLVPAWLPEITACGTCNVGDRRKNQSVEDAQPSGLSWWNLGRGTLASREAANDNAEILKGISSIACRGGEDFRVASDDLFVEVHTAEVIMCQMRGRMGNLKIDAFVSGSMCVSTTHCGMAEFTFQLSFDRASGLPDISLHPCATLETSEIVRTIPKFERRQLTDRTEKAGHAVKLTVVPSTAPLVFCSYFKPQPACVPVTGAYHVKEVRPNVLRLLLQLAIQKCVSVDLVGFQVVMPFGHIGYIHDFDVKASHGTFEVNEDRRTILWRLSRNFERAENKGMDGDSDRHDVSLSGELTFVSDVVEARTSEVFHGSLIGHISNDLPGAQEWNAATRSMEQMLPFGVRRFVFYQARSGLQEWFFSGNTWRFIGNSGRNSLTDHVPQVKDDEIRSTYCDACDITDVDKTILLKGSNNYIAFVSFETDDISITGANVHLSFTNLSKRSGQVGDFVARNEQSEASASAPVRFRYTKHLSTGRYAIWNTLGDFTI